MANLLSRCGKLTEFLLAEGNTQAAIDASGLQGAQVLSLTFDLSSADRVGARKTAKGGKKKAAKGGKKASRGGKKTAKGGRKKK